jgi:hypothetical protein
VRAAGGTVAVALDEDLVPVSSGASGLPVAEARSVNTAVATSGGGRAAENIGFAIAIDEAYRSWTGCGKEATQLLPATSA